MEAVVSKRNSMVLASLGAMGALVLGCSKTGEGEYEVQRPVIGTTTDTVRVPTVEVGRDTQRIVTPDIDVNAPGRRDTTRRP